MSGEEPKKPSSGAALDKLKEVAPQIQNILNQAKPLLEKLEPVIRATVPYVVVIKDYAIQGYCVVQPYWDKEVGSVALALVLLFFGGNFALTIACWQVFQISGHRLVSKSWEELRTSFQEALATLKKDPEAAAIFGVNHGNIAVSQIWTAFKDLALATKDEEKKHARHKIALLLKCIDPTKIWDATIGLWTGLVAILATLRSRFVQSITIGANVGKKAVEIMMPLVQPKLNEAFPQHTKWVDFCLRSSGGIIGAITALMLIRVISAFNLALEGANLLVKYLLLIKERKGYLSTVDFTLQQSRAAIWVVAMLGFVVQFRAGFSLPLLLKIPLMPLILVEWILTLLAARPF